MSFAENLRQIRISENLSQEDLAELMDVSRQAVSKWEQGVGYPEAEKLLLLSKKLNVSLDSLMETGISAAHEATRSESTHGGEITITSQTENVVMTCGKIVPFGPMKGGKDAPKFALGGVGKGKASFGGETTTFLGWYKNREQLSKEISEIKTAIARGASAYELKYSVEVEKRLFSVKIKQPNG